MLNQTAERLFFEVTGGFPAWTDLCFGQQEVYKEQIFRNAYHPLKGWNLGPR